MGRSDASCDKACVCMVCCFRERLPTYGRLVEVSNEMVCLRHALCAAVVAVFFTIVTSQDDAAAAGDESVDYPTYNEVPKDLSFSCKDKIPGYYADPDTQCQVWHWCLPTGRKFSFLCPNGTVFNQLYRVCDWHYNVDCPAAPEKYDINNDLYKDKDGNPI